MMRKRRRKKSKTKKRFCNIPHNAWQDEVGDGDAVNHYKKDQISSTGDQKAKADKSLLPLFFLILSVLLCC